MTTHKNNDHGLSEVIGFVLILALIIVAISLWMTYVLPAQGRELEISHMDYVGQWFLDYKISVDSLWMNYNRDVTDSTTYLTRGVTDSTTLTLGSEGGNTQTSGLFLPMMQPIGSSGSLSINNTQDMMTIKTSNNQNFTIPMSSLVYQSNNNYWIQQQYYYQMGGIFLSQDINGFTGVTNVVSPLISIYNVSKNDGSNTNITNIVIVPVQLNGGGTISGEGKARLNFRLQEQQPYILNNPNSWITISVKVKDSQTAIMWRNLFSDIVKRENIKNYNNLITNQNMANITLYGPSVNLELNRADFYTSLNTVASV
jgi:hypothetical protein